MYTGFWWGNLKERDYLGDSGVDGECYIKMDLKDISCEDVGWEHFARDIVSGY